MADELAFVSSDPTNFGARAEAARIATEKLHEKYPDGWQGVRSTINVEAVRAEEKRLGRDLTYAERVQLTERLRKR